MLFWPLLVFGKQEKKKREEDHDALLRKSRSSPAANTQKRLHNTDKKKRSFSVCEVINSKEFACNNVRLRPF